MAARRLVGAGAKIVIADLNGDAAARRGRARPVGREAAAGRLRRRRTSSPLDLAEKSFGAPVSAAVSTAGTLHAAKAVSRKGCRTRRPFERVFGVNVLGSFNVARLAAARMAARAPDAETGERGVLVQTASIAAFDGQAGRCAYAASKVLIVGMTLPLARDLAPLGSVAIVAPGVFETPMMAAASDEVRDGLPSRSRSRRASGAPTSLRASSSTPSRIRTSTAR